MRISWTTKYSVFSEKSLTFITETLAFPIVHWCFHGNEFFIKEQLIVTFYSQHLILSDQVQLCVFKYEYQFNVQLFSSWVAFKTIRSHSNQVEFVTYCVVWVWSKLEGFLICDFDLYCSLCLSLDECSWALLEDFLYILT